MSKEYNLLVSTCKKIHLGSYDEIFRGGLIFCDVFMFSNSIGLFVIPCRNGLNGVNPQLVTSSITGAGTSGTIPTANHQQQQQQQQAFMAQLQQQVVAASYAATITSLPPGVAYSQSVGSGKGTGSDCSSTPSSPRDSSDENDRGRLLHVCYLAHLVFNSVECSVMMPIDGATNSLKLT